MVVLGSFSLHATFYILLLLYFFTKPYCPSDLRGHVPVDQNRSDDALKRYLLAVLSASFFLNINVEEDPG